MYNIPKVIFSQVQIGPCVFNSTDSDICPLYKRNMHYVDNVAKW